MKAYFSDHGNQLFVVVVLMEIGFFARGSEVGAFFAFMLLAARNFVPALTAIVMDKANRIRERKVQPSLLIRPGA